MYQKYLFVFKYKIEKYKMFGNNQQVGNAPQL